jgi:hypothetical protein
MATIASDVNGAVASFIEENAKLPGRCTVRLDQFDDRFENVYPSTDVNDVPKFTLRPRNMTALHDAIGKTVTQLGEELAALPEDERPGKVLVVVATDGLENASREWNAKTVKELIERQQNQYSWEFVFLAANQDAVTTGGHLGFKGDSSITFATTSAGVANTTRSLNAYATSYRAGGQAAFSEADRLAATEQ